MDRIKAKQTESDNQYYMLGVRILELERHSRKTCLIINSIDVDDEYSGFGNSLSLLNSRLQLNLVPADIAAYHPLAKPKVALVILKFVYHHHLDLVWRRKSWLEGVLNSKQKAIVIEKILAPSDRNINAEQNLRKPPIPLNTTRVCFKCK